MRYSFTMNAVIALIFANSAMGQESVNAAGGNGSSLNGKISYSVGQVSYKVVSNSNVKINEGVQQPIQVTAVVLPTDLVVSNYISPNNDGNNDTWKMIPLEIAAKYAIVISDQWGTVVFQKDGNYQNEWDATFSGKKLPDGVYYYSLLEKDQVVGKGSITVLSN